MNNKKRLFELMERVSGLPLNEEVIENELISRIPLWENKIDEALLLINNLEKHVLENNYENDIVYSDKSISNLILYIKNNFNLLLNGINGKFRHDDAQYIPNIKLDYIGYISAFRHFLKQYMMGISTTSMMMKIYFSNKNDTFCVDIISNIKNILNVLSESIRNTSIDNP